MKWVEAIPLRSMTTKVICHFILENISAQFVPPLNLVSDNGTSFKNNKVKKFLETSQIHNFFSTPYYLQSNGQAKENE